MKVLSIGNSFSCDATRYLNQLASHTNTQLLSENLYIGACSLQMHYTNLISNEEAYELQVHGECVYKTSLKDALVKHLWDYITLQQASHLSGDYTTYQPYLNELVKQIRILCPKAKIVIHQTWAYENGSDRLQSMTCYENHMQMFEALKKAYDRAAEDIQAVGMIRSGELMMNLAKNGLSKVYRDTFHAGLGAGRYALALLWYKFFTKKRIDDIDFDMFDEPISQEEMAIIKKSVNEICQ